MGYIADEIANESFQPMNEDGTLRFDTWLLPKAKLEQRNAVILEIYQTMNSVEPDLIKWRSNIRPEEVCW